VTNRGVFLDRDGTMAEDVHYCCRLEDFELFPDTVKAVKLLNELGFKVIVITNQSGIARGYFTEETLVKIHEKMERELAKEDAWVDAIYYCPHHPDDQCKCRKPHPTMLLQAASELKIDLARSYMIGDMDMDIQMGQSVGCKTLLVTETNRKLALETIGEGVRPNAVVPNLLEAVQTILKWETK